MPLDKYELERYSRQLPLIGVERQEKLKSSTVLIVGAGGLGSVISVYLTYIGVGRVIIVDDGIVELNNLNRQIIYSDRDVNEPKAVVACR
ncbi:MAG: ThiF family adenylyltransferase, partial [Ignisphaera sp.]